MHKKEEEDLVSREIKAFREKLTVSKPSSAGGAADEEEEAEAHERRRRDREDREREREREARRREKEDKEYRERERAWEDRERTKEREREREAEKQRRQGDRAHRDEDFDDSERAKRRSEWGRMKRDWQLERAEDEAEARREAIAAAQAQALAQTAQAQSPPGRSAAYNPTDAYSPPASLSPAPFDAQPGALGKITFQKKKAVAPAPGYGEKQEEEEAEDAAALKKKRKLVPLDFNSPEAQITKEGKLAAIAAQEKQAKMDRVKDLISRIPTEKEALFAYPVDYEVLEEHNVLEKKMRPWVSKKIAEYLGEEDRALITFILGKITARVPPHDFVDQLKLVLEEEAEVRLVSFFVQCSSSFCCFYSFFCAIVFCYRLFLL